MKTEKEFITEYKMNNPIRETSGSGTGTYKWRRYLDCIDMRYGHDTRKAAEMDRAASAKDAYQGYAYSEQEVTCPKCGGKTTQQYIDTMGSCWDCEKKKPAYSHMGVI